MKADWVAKKVANRWRRAALRAWRKRIKSFENNAIHLLAQTGLVPISSRILLRIPFSPTIQCVPKLSPLGTRVGYEEDVDRGNIGLNCGLKYNCSSPISR